jgi:hypothetical protein
MTIPAVTDTTIPPGVLTELTRLRAEFPGHWIGTEIIPGRGGRYVARARQHDVHPHTVITADLPELRAALEAGRPHPAQP